MTGHVLKMSGHHLWLALILIPAINTTTILNEIHIKKKYSNTTTMRTGIHIKFTNKYIEKKPYGQILKQTFLV